MKAELREWIMQKAAHYEIRSGQAGTEDAAQFVQLLNDHYGRAYPQAHYQWQFFADPYDNQVVLAFDHGQCVGAHGVYLLPLAGAMTGVLAQPVDLILHADVRRGGLYFRLDEAIVEIAKSRKAIGLYTAPNANAYSPRINHLGWHEMATMRFYRKPLNLLTEQASSPAGLELRDLDFTSDGEVIDQIMKAFGVAYPGLSWIRRDLEFLRWRFHQRPQMRYTGHVMYSGSQAVGYFILKRFQESPEAPVSGDVVDMLIASDETALKSACLRMIELQCIHEGITSSQLWLQSESIWLKAALAEGYAPTEIKRKFCARDLCDALPADTELYLSMADCELF